MSWFINKNFFGSGCYWALGGLTHDGQHYTRMVHIRFTHFIVTITWCWCITLYWVHIDWFGMKECLGSSKKTSSMTCFCRVLNGLTHHGQHYTGMVHIRFTHFIVTITWCWCITSYWNHIDWFGMMECFVSSTMTCLVTCFCGVLNWLTQHVQHYMERFISDLHIPL